MHIYCSWLNWQERQTHSISSSSLTWPQQQRKKKKKESARFSELNQREWRRRRRKMKIGLVIIIFPFLSLSLDIGRYSWKSSINRPNFHPITILIVMINWCNQWRKTSSFLVSVALISNIQVTRAYANQDLSFSICSMLIFSRGKFYFVTSARWWKSKWNERKNRWTLLWHRSIWIGERGGERTRRRRMMKSSKNDDINSNLLHWCLY